MDGGSEIALSVIVTVVGGTAFLPRCLRPLVAQAVGRSVEVIVPYDATVGDIDAVRAEFPQIAFLDLGAAETEAPAGSLAAAHELYDRRRACGLRVARGAVVALIEDYEVPAADWVEQVLTAHHLPHTVIGGAVEHAGHGLLNWAVYLLDFGRYQRPLTEGFAAYLTDVNVSYKRAALDATRDLWAERYHEVTVHWDLARQGHTLWRRPQMVVSQDRGRLALGPTLAERFVWGRLFGTLRAREQSLAGRLAYAALSPLIPAVLLARVARKVFAGRRHRATFMAALPVTALLAAVWSLGEATGYVTGRSASARESS